MTVGWTIYVRERSHGQDRSPGMAGVFRGKHSEAHAWCKAENARQRDAQPAWARDLAPVFRVTYPLDAVEWAFAEVTYRILGGAS